VTMSADRYGFKGSVCALVMFFALGYASPAQVAEIRIGYVNVSRVLEEAPLGVAALKKLETEFRPRDKELVALQGRIQQLEEELQKGSSSARSSELRMRERELLTLKREHKRSAQEFREDHNQRRQEELSNLQQAVQKAIVEIAKQEKYDLVVYEGALYASEAVDITEKVLKKLGKP
jgi:outer membrane protein